MTTVNTMFRRKPTDIIVLCFISPVPYTRAFGGVATGNIKAQEAVCEEDVDISNLLTIPGIGYFSAGLIKSEIIDISHFRSFNRLCAYCGLAPRVNISGNRIIYGPLNKNRRKNLQWILLENVYHFIRGSWEREERFERIKKRKGHNTAKVAMARDMLKIIYHVLKERRPYYRSKKVEIQSVATAALSGV